MQVSKAVYYSIPAHLYMARVMNRLIDSYLYEARDSTFQEVFLH